MSSYLQSKSNDAPINSVDSYYDGGAATVYNDKLDTQHVEVPVSNESIIGELTMKIAPRVVACFSPKLVVVIFRIVKNWTLFCLILTVLSELMYLVVMMLLFEFDGYQLIGGNRDGLMRTYGIILAFLAITIERDMILVDDNYSIVKLFIPRSLLLLFITLLSCPFPILDFSFSGQDYYSVNTAMVLDGFPGFAVAFQVGTAYALSSCAGMYFLLGCLCLDRFKSEAFLANEEFEMPTRSDSNLEPDGDANSFTDATSFAR